MKGLKVYQESEIQIHLSVEEGQTEQGFTTVSDSVKSIGVKIEAARSGKINRNFVLYTPKAMDNGMLSFIEPFEKHLQSKHNGDAVGVIKEATYVEEYFPQASDNFIEIVKRVKEASENSDGRSLVRAVKELIKTEEYKSSDYKGLGIANIKGEIHDPNTIYQIRTKDRSKGTVSIGGKSREVYCSICSGKGSNSHVHKRGKIYSNEVCFYIHNDLELDHCGFVTEPADKDTNTQIVSDAKQDDLIMDVLNYTDNNPSAEQTMNLEALKQKINDKTAVEALISEYIPDPDQAAIALEEYENSLPNSKPNHYLFSTESLLNIKTPVGIYLSEKLLEDLEDSAEKGFIQQSLNTIKKAKDIEKSDEALKDFLDAKKAEKDLEKPETEAAETPADDKESEEETTEVKDNVSGEMLTEPEYLANFMTKLGTLFDQKIGELKEAVKVEDAVQTEYAKQELETLRKTLDTDQVALDQMSNSYKDSLVDQIILLKDNNVSPDYLEKLKTRSTDQLKTTIEDLRELRDLGNKEDTAETTVTKTSTEEAINRVKDQFQGTAPDAATEEEKPSTETTEEPTDKDEEVKVEDHLELDPEKAFLADTKIMSMSAAFKKHKKYLNTKRTK